MEPLTRLVESRNPLVVHIAVAGSSTLGSVGGLTSDPAALLTCVADAGPGHVLVLTPRHLERRSREQAHVLVAAQPDRPVGVLALDHHALTLTLVAAALVELRDDPQVGWTDAGELVHLVHQAAARSRSIVWHSRALGLRRPVPTVAQSAASLVRSPGYFAELGECAGLTRGSVGLVRDGEELLCVAGEPPALLARQLGDVSPTVVDVSPDPSAPYRSRRSVELCGLAGPAWAPMLQHRCQVCGTSRPPSGCLFCGTGAIRSAVSVTTVGV